MNRIATIAIIALIVLAAFAGAEVLIRGYGNGRHPIPPSKQYDITVNFGNTGTGQGLRPLPYPFFGVGGVGSSKLSSNPEVLKLLLSSGIGWTRVEAQLPLVFPNASSIKSPDFSYIDAELQAATSNGFSHIIILIDYTPAWLANISSFPCLTAEHYPPSNFTEWGKMAAIIVQHIYEKFNLPKYYIEIWNEPDAATFLCVDPADREAVYFSIFRAAAVAITTQLSSNRIVLGGPALANPVRDSRMLYDLVHDSRIEGYIGFISYHQYSLASKNDTWLGGANSVLDAEQNALTGYAAVYVNISNIVHHGLQPNASRTPIFIDEYNTNAILPGCCGNSPLYSPLYNALLVADLFESSMMNGSDGSMPGAIVYFTLSSPVTGACMFGTWDSGMDCATSGQIQPYPSFYAYQLIGSDQYLAAGKGSYLAGYQTALSDITLLPILSNMSYDLLIVNPYQTTLSNVSILFKDIGSQACPGQANLYTVASRNNSESIESGQVSVYAAQGGCAIFLSYVAGYTVEGIALQRG